MISVFSTRLVIQNRNGLKKQTVQKVGEEQLKCDNVGESDVKGETTENNHELNNNSICILDHSKTPPPSKDPYWVNPDMMIQNQFDIHSLAVKNILAISSEDIYAKVKKVRTKVICFSSEDISQTEKSLISIVEDLEFEEALCKFSEESLSMSTENIMTNSLKNVSSVFKNKSTTKSMNIPPMNAEGRSNI